MEVAETTKGLNVFIGEILALYLIPRREGVVLVVSIPDLCTLTFIEMPFVCQSFRNTFVSAPYLLNPLIDFQTSLISSS